VGRNRLCSACEAVPPAARSSLCCTVALARRRSRLRPELRPIKITRISHIHTVFVGPCASGMPPCFRKLSVRPQPGRNPRKRTEMFCCVRANCSPIVLDKFLDKRTYYASGILVGVPHRTKQNETKTAPPPRSREGLSPVRPSHAALRNPVLIAAGATGTRHGDSGGK
jgi:hypothetical protein